MNGTVADAIYPSSMADAEGKPLDSAQRYTIHFAPTDVPPVNAFWSLTMYDDRQLFAPNRLNRFAIGDRDPMKKNDDGSIDLYIQRDLPGPDKESNWLPAPKDGRFSMNLRLYWPKPAVLEGVWVSPAVVRAAGDR